MVTISEEAINEYRAFRPYDMELERLLSITLGFDDENTGNSIGLTLIVKGSVISGLAVTHDAWTKTSISELRAAEKDGATFVAEVLERIATNSAELLLENKEEREAKESGRYPSGRRAINLTNVTVGVGANRATLPTMRVLMDSIDAWSIGQINNS